MYKKLPQFSAEVIASFNLIFLTMKLTILFCLVTLLQVRATSYGQKITLNVTDVPLERCLDNIKQQSNYHFLYDDELLKQAKLVTIRVINEPLAAVLTKCFKNQPFTYVIKNNNVIIVRIPPVTVTTLSPLDNTVLGVVTDDKGKPLLGVNIRIKNTEIGTTTDKEGRYTLSGVKPDAVLVFSFVGYATKEISVKGQSIINISLVPKQDLLNDLVVVGYGTSKRRDLTGAVTTAPIADMVKAPVSNIADALEGRIAGLVVSSYDGQPGSMPSVTLRGPNSVSQDNSPLYVIDGFPIQGVDLNSYNADDIESIEVLKDASATAIYGSRGANGVILITTKKGKNGAPIVSFDATAGFQTILKQQAVLTPYQFLQYYQEKNKLTNSLYIDPITGASGPGTQTDSVYLKYSTLDDYKNIKGTSLQNQLFTNSPFKNYNIALRGGNDKTTYSLSGNILDANGIMINSGTKRNQGRIVIDQKVNNKLKVGINASYSNVINTGGSPSSSDINSGLSARSPLYGIWATSPVSPINNTGKQSTDLSTALFDPALLGDGLTPLLLNPVINQRHTLRQITDNTLSANGYFEYQILPSLYLRVTGGINNTVERNVSFNDTLSSQGNSRTSTNGANGAFINSNNNSWLNENILTYSQIFKGGHTLSVNGIVSEQAANSYSNGASAILLPNPSLGVSGLDEGTPVNISATSTNWSLASFTGRVNYSYKMKYFFTATYRADGSSRFAPQNKWGYFPSAAFKWRFTDEQFFTKQHILTDGSLRLSYGKTGNNGISDFAYLSPIGYTLAGAVFNNVVNNGAAPSSLANPSLKWETTAQTNIGTDLYFFNNRVTLIADIYRKVTSDLLLNATVPPTSGYSNAFNNIGSVQNQGLELSLNATVYKNKDFMWTTSFNIAWNQNKVLALAQNQEALLSIARFDAAFGSSPGYIAKIGKPLGQFYGLVSDGLYQYSDFNYISALNPSAGYSGTGSHFVLKDNVPSNGLARGIIQPGDVKYKDLNKDGIINASDQTFIGQGLPIGTGGFNNNFTYKNLTLNIFFQFSYGNNIQNANRILLGSPGGNGSGALTNFFESVVNRWTPTNTNTNINRIGGNGPMGFYSNRTIEDGSYIRLKTLQLDYNLPIKLLQKAGFRTFKFFVSGQNILTWTKYSGLDPEISTFRSVLTPGLDFSGYPRGRTITFGTHISF